MRFWTGTLLAVLAGALSAAGCGPQYRTTAKEDRVIERIEKGYYRTWVPPTTLISVPKKLYAVGEDIRVTLRIVAPAEDQALDPYLPIRGRLHVKRDGAIRELRPPRSSARLAWAELPVDGKRARERSFTITVNRIFNMSATGWYIVWWEATDDVGHRMQSTELYVRVMARVPE